MSAESRRSDDRGDEPLPAVHLWQRCHGCGAAPIVGPRYACLTCPVGPNNHLCAHCFAAMGRGTVIHPLPNSYESFIDLPDHEFVEVCGSSIDYAAAWMASPDIAAEPPWLRDGFVLRPEFASRTGSHLGTYACAVEWHASRRPLVLTVLHVLDELARASGIDCSVANEFYTARELPACVERVHLYDALAENWMLAPLGTASRMLVLADARMHEDEPYCHGDLAAFVADVETSVRPVPLAAVVPDVGAPIWLVAKQPRGGPSLHAAVVVESAPRTMIYRFAENVLPPSHTSGAPLLNGAGEVIGLNIGSGCSKDGATGMRSMPAVSAVI